MLPNIGFLDTYSVMLFIGIIICFWIFLKYGIKNNLSRNYIYDILLMTCVVIGLGILSAFGFQRIFDVLKSNSTNGIGSMTFFGGLFGGVLAFLLGYKFYIKKKYPQSSFIKDIAMIAPACICIAHCFGRIGCFFAGCCYGKQTDSFLGIKFPGMLISVYPTQLFEALFLLLLFCILFYLAYYKKNIFTLPIYAVSYGAFRFLIEFIRGDDRGVFILNLSPSQWFSIISVIIGIILFIHYKKKFKNIV